jgi:beta propeller repeat protein
MNSKQNRIKCAGLVGLVMVVLVSGAARADILTTDIHTITATTDAFETTPTIGENSNGSYVVYTKRSLSGGTIQPGDIYYQRVGGNGAPIGAAIKVSMDADGSVDDKLNDISGNRIVYTSFMSGGALIRLYNISSASAMDLTSLGKVYRARIDGDVVAWVQGTPGATEIDMVNLSWSVLTPLKIGGGSPAATKVEVGSNYIVWQSAAAGGSDIVAYRISTGQTTTVAGDPALDEKTPATSGDWVVWQSTDASTNTTIQAKNVITGETRTVVDDGSYVQNPSIDGDLITYESDLKGNFDVYVYRLSTGETFAVTNDAADQQLNNVYGNLVAWVDFTNGQDISAASLSFGPPNQPPVANAGPDQTVHAGSVVTLDGSSSSDPDGNYPLSYTWTVLSKPSGSAATLSDPTAVNPSFTADVTGDYTLSLTVTDSLGLASAADTVLVSTTNTPPIADAGPDQALIALGSTVQLDGNQSWDPDGDTIHYAWTLTSKPSGSTAVLSDAAIINPTFIADVQGTYEAQLVVDDGWATSAPDSVAVSFNNIKPVADAGGNQAVNVGDVVALDGSGSSDANLDPLTYSWSLVSTPAGSQAMLNDADTVYPSFTADMAGNYVASLVVNDSFVGSEPSNVTVTATSVQDDVATILKQSVDTINHDIDPTNLKNKNMAKALTNKLTAALELIDQGQYQDALDKLQHDVLPKTDGCAVAGSPDRNDWIETCTDQNLLYPAIMNAIELLQGM